MCISEHHLRDAWVGNMRALIGIAPRPHFGVFQRVVTSVLKSKKAAFVRLECWRRFLCSEFWQHKEQEGIKLPDASQEVLRICCSLRDYGPSLAVQCWDMEDRTVERFDVGLCDESIDRFNACLRQGRKLEIQGGWIDSSSPRFFTHSSLSGQRWDTAKGLTPCSSPHI